jgi:transposase
MKSLTEQLWFEVPGRRGFVNITGTVEKLVADAGSELLFLPIYSPDLNPIEHLWAKLKAVLRRLLPNSHNPALTISNMCKCYAS